METVQRPTEDDRSVRFTCYTSRDVQTDYIPSINSTWQKFIGLGTNNPIFLKDLADLSSLTKPLHYLCQCV